MDLLTSYDIHRDSLLKVLSGLSVPRNNNSKAVEAFIGKMVEANKISFLRDELPIGGGE